MDKLQFNYNANQKLIYLIFLLISFSSCKTEYYMVQSDYSTPIHRGDPIKGHITNIEPNTFFAIQSNYKRTIVRYGKTSGKTIYSNRFKVIGKISKRNLRNVEFNKKTGYAYGKYLKRKTTNYTKSRNNSNSSSSNYYRSSSSNNGTVYVNGYYRKDGTYVRPHTRSAPRRN